MREPYRSVEQTEKLQNVVDISRNSVVPKPPRPSVQVAVNVKIEFENQSNVWKGVFRTSNHQQLSFTSLLLLFWPYLALSANSKCKNYLILIRHRQTVLADHDYDGAKINIGGRQRMLSKKYSMETSAVLLGYIDNNQTVVDEYLANVEETRSLWMSSKVDSVMN
jgi:hypothetical protein